jgi:hypothetical protein
MDQQYNIVFSNNKTNMQIRSRNYYSPCYFHHSSMRFFLELIMCFVRTNRIIGGNKSGHPMCRPPHLHRNTHQFIVGMIHIFPRSSSIIILCMMTQAVMIYQRHSWSQNLAAPLTMANCACKISNTLSTSFLAVACAL